MEKTPDLTVVQKAIIDNLHKAKRSKQEIAKEAGCPQTVLRGRGKFGQKRHSSDRDGRIRERIVKHR